VRREAIATLERLGEAELLELAHVALEGEQLAAGVLGELGGLRLRVLLDEGERGRGDPA